MPDAAAPFAAYLGGTVFHGRLTLRSPLHIGTGFARIESREADETSDVAEVIRGASDQPVLTPTALKGAMRAIVSAACGAEMAKRMFGEILDHGDAAGRAGVLTPFAAPMRPPPQQGASAMTRSVRAAIDAAYGVPADRLLINADMVAPGAVFDLRLRLSGDPRVTPTDILSTTAALLRSLQLHGLRLGHGRGDGQGHLLLSALDKVEETFVANRRMATRDALQGWNRCLDAQVPLATPAQQRWTLHFRSDTPFLVQDPERTSAPALGQDGRARRNIIRALKRDPGIPDLPGTSFMGALRARAEWLLRLRQMRGQAQCGEALRVIKLFGLRAEQQRDASTVGQLAKSIGLPPAAVTGFAGLLVVEEIAFANPQLVTLPGVKLDRFTHGPIDGQLFETEAFLFDRLTVTLRLKPHPCNPHEAQALVDWVGLLLDEIGGTGPRAGLQLGHGGNRGYGWCELEKPT